MKHTRAGEMWFEWDGFGNTQWHEVLILETKRVAFDQQWHTCINLVTGKVYQTVEMMNALWEDTPTERVIDTNPCRFNATLHRKRIL